MQCTKSVFKMKRIEGERKRWCMRRSSRPDERGRSGPEGIGSVMIVKKTRMPPGVGGTGPAGQCFSSVSVTMSPSSFTYKPDSESGNFLLPLPLPSGVSLIPSWEIVMTDSSEYLLMIRLVLRRRHNSRHNNFPMKMRQTRRISPRARFVTSSQIPPGPTTHIIRPPKLEKRDLPGHHQNFYPLG